MIVQMSDLNDERFGRFGNQLFKFFFLKIIQHEIDCEIRYPNWLGNLAFNLPTSVSPISTTDQLVVLPDANQSLKEVLQLIREKIISGPDVIDVKGFFQFHTREYAEYKNLFHDIFAINQHLLSQIAIAMNAANPHRYDVISIHLRRGDYANYADNRFFWMTSVQSIFDSLENLKFTSFQKEIVYLCSDDMNYCTNEFSNREVSYISADALFSYTEDSLRLLVDFFSMTLSNVAIISNSSLSFFASMLNRNARIFLRPAPHQELLVPFDPWNSNVLLAKNFQ